ncbi:MAG: protein phosphatase 2C domain-containing protein [Gemmatimonadota bacterium]|nr:protein phosphatase 2C domain-containing protein [Gemmatimonadota bacterium]
MPHDIAIAGRTHVGQVRRRNEDWVEVVPELGVAVVADGMGGHPGGDVASRLAADTTARVLSEAIEAERGEQGFSERLREVMSGAVLSAHEAIRARGTVERELDGMGTTLTAMVINLESGAWVIGHVGDSRAYRLRGGTLEQLTRDDTWVQDQIDRGGMPEESARLSPYAHLLTQCVGLEDPPTPQLLAGVAQAGDAFLLCTDGLVGMITDNQIERLLGEAHDAPGTDSLDVLLEAANRAGGQDNITAAIVCFG